MGVGFGFRAAKRRAGVRVQMTGGEVRSDCLPEDKLKYIEAFQNGGQQVCMIGDDINDAPALKMAHVGIAMGGIGSDIAV